MRPTLQKENSPPACPKSLEMKIGKFADRNLKLKIYANGLLDLAQKHIWLQKKWRLIERMQLKAKPTPFACLPPQ